MQNEIKNNGLSLSEASHVIRRGGAFFLYSYFLFLFFLLQLHLLTKSAVHSNVYEFYALHFLTIFLLKMDSTILFTHLKIFCYNIFSF